MKHQFKGTPVYNPYLPRDLTNGGYIYKKKNMTQKQLNNDSVIGILRPGEIVIPVKYKNRNSASLVKKYLMSQKIYLPHLKENN